MRVTAAYEMPHAAYAALAPSDRKAVDSIVEDAFRASRDERLRALSGELAALPARDRLDAFHSLLGTQVAQFPHDLEHYYFSPSRTGNRWSARSGRTRPRLTRSTRNSTAHAGDRRHKAQVVAMHQQVRRRGRDQADRLTAQLKDVNKDRVTH